MDFFESLFDFDGDGELTFADDVLEFMVFNEIMGSDDEDKDDDLI